MSDKPWLAHYDSGVQASLVYRDIPLFTFLDEVASAHPDLICTIFRDNPITYGDMRLATGAFASVLMQASVKKGDRVGLLLPNCPQFVLAYYGILKAGGIVVAMNPQYKQRELAFQLQNAGVEIVIALDSYRPVLEEACQSAHIRRVIYTQIEDAFSISSVLHSSQQQSGSEFLKLLQQLADQPAESVVVNPDDPAIFQYSGGTTGIPKGAIGLHRNLVANTIQFRNWLYGMEQNSEVVLCAIPLFHVYGMVIAMSLGVALGARLVLIPNPREVQDVLENIDRYGATLFPGVPNMYHSINQHPDVKAGKYNLRTIKACISGSAPLLRDIKDQFESLTGGKLIEGYGLSEAPTATHCNPMFGENRTGSIGLPLSDVDCRIVDLQTGERDLQPGDAGELVISGPQVMHSYHNMPDETQQVLRKGWLYTGDIARMDEDGYFYLIDRKKELIKIGGLQVWPREIEEVVMVHPKVLEVAAAGVPHPTRVEIVKAWVVLRPGEEMTAAEVKNWCEENLASFKVPSEVEFRTSLPRTMVGKLLRRELIREHIENRGTSPS
jgi:long-chain acyl-CoA synthetase